jgi:hypothetical protein
MTIAHVAILFVVVFTNVEVGNKVSRDFHFAQSSISEKTSTASVAVSFLKTAS